MVLSDLKQLIRKYLFDGEILRLMALVMLVKPLGLITQVLLAKYFGAGSQYDAYALAVFIAMFIGSILGQDFTSIIVPYVIKLRSSLEPKQVLGFQNSIVAMYGVPALFLTLLLFLFPGTVVDIAGPGLATETRGYAVRMVRYLAVPGALILAVAMGNAILNLNRKFRLATSMPVVHSATVLLAIITLNARMGIWSVVVGFAASQVLQTALIWGRALVSRYVIVARPFLPEGTVSKLWSLSRALLLTQTFLLLCQFIDRMFASALETGSISSIAYAMTIKTFAVQLFQLTLVVVMFTKQSELIAAGEFRRFGEFLRDNIGRVCRLVVPASLVFCLASSEIVRVLFQRGAFTAADAERTAGVLAMYALGLPAFIVNLIVGRVFHSLQRMREKMLLGGQYLVTNVALNALLVGSLKVMGLALASTITINIHLLLSLWVLHRYRLGMGVDKWVRVFTKYHVIAIVTYLVYLLTGFSKLLAEWSIAGTVAGDLAIGVCKGLFVCLVFGGLLWISRALPKRITG